ncbi:MAG: YcbK family protein [Deltaproteobacteria bacterium]|nr:YcbK family protein [Deltaproteobacteria bacterium]
MARTNHQPADLSTRRNIAAPRSLAFVPSIARRLAPVLAVLAAGAARADDGDGKKWQGPEEGAIAAGTREVPWLHLVNLYTSDALPVFGETLSMESFRRLTRCRATGKTTEMDPALPKLILAAAKKLEGSVVEVISGFRSEKFNEQLRKKGHEVASESFHRKGRALDWRLQGIPLQRLVAYLKRHHRGGLGTYRKSNFVHTDTGPKREWRGR